MMQSKEEGTRRPRPAQPAQATQTAEVTGEPVYQICKKDSQSISSAWIDVEKQAYEDAGIYPEYGRRTLYAHPAPSVRADVVRVPLQVLKDASEALGNFVSDHGWGDTDMQAMDNLDAYIARHEAIDAAIAAAK